tara:strand:- start:40192 stop:41091 length:900 start_codon:yes stop_codon:yes gene_type:complete
MTLKDIAYVENKLDWLEESKIWPNGLRHLCTDAFGLVLYVSLFLATEKAVYMIKAESLVDEVYRVLGREKGLRIGEEEDQDGQYYHYLVMWIFALYCLGKIKPEYKIVAVNLAKTIHSPFVRSGQGVIWKMTEDLKAPYPGYGLGAMGAFNGYVVYKLLDESIFTKEIHELFQLVSHSYETLSIDQDLGMMLWLVHFYPEEDWAICQKKKSLDQLEKLWVSVPGYFCRQQGNSTPRFAFTNYGTSLGLQANAIWPQRVQRINRYFEGYKSRDEYDVNAITHVMACTSHFPGLFIRGYNK